ncbi:MAG TPA: methyl-accepting chemotaxis protein [Alphaproteobacteria bacterium]|nr:methyl-accepting chemotaxis protein [Alphaproteobacteria bacterium]
MFGSATKELEAKFEAINKSQAIIEFNLDGTVITANENFLRVLGYSLGEIQGRHHSMFVDPAFRDTQDYRVFWENLRDGRFQSAAYKRIGKNNKIVWIRATYNPMFDKNGKPYKVIKLASDITDQKNQDNYLKSQIDAINKSQAVIEFELDGTVVNANENFLRTLGYTLDEIKGRHHSMFVDSTYRDSTEYRRFWEDLRAGKCQADEYKRIAKNGNEVWIQASYNPMYDLDNRPYRVIKFAMDKTPLVVARLENIRGIEEASEALKSFSQGDLTKRIEGEYSGDIKKLKEAVNITAEKLTAMIQEIMESVTVINEGIESVSSGSEMLSMRTEQQASNLQETAASMEEISSTVKQTSDNVQEASNLGSSSHKLAKTGGEIVNATVNAMKEIEEASNKISEITTMIDEIAFQTNLLALNAAVEAARAGDAGKGFAVVADEVRSLAQRASAASKQIKGLITGSDVSVKNGVSYSTKAGESIQQVVELSTKLADVISQIASASSEQTIGLDQINIAVSQLDQVTQENGAMVQQSTAAVSSLKEQVDRLSALMGTFVIEESSYSRH